MMVHQHSPRVLPRASCALLLAVLTLTGPALAAQGAAPGEPGQTATWQEAEWRAVATRLAGTEIDAQHPDLAFVPVSATELADSADLGLLPDRERSVREPLGDSAAVESGLSAERSVIARILLIAALALLALSSGLLFAASQQLRKLRRLGPGEQRGKHASHAPPSA